MRTVAIPLLAGLTASGCGLILLGPRQTIPVASAPDAAVVELAGHELRKITPAEVRVRRRPAWIVIRVSKPGYRAACALLEGDRPNLLVVADSMPLAVPLLIDVIAGSLREYPVPPAFDLQPLTPDGVEVLPDADTILSAWENAQINYCQPTAALREALDFRSRNLTRAQKIFVSAGDISQQPYTILGRVDQKAFGFDYWTGYSWAVSTGRITLGSTEVFHHEAKPEPTVLNELLQLEAVRRYHEVDAIINVHYETLPGNDVSAGGLAVAFRSEGR
jgi:hypothetical protein